MYNNLDYMQAAFLEEDENLLAVAVLVVRDRVQRRRQRQRQREVWVKPWFLRRPLFGQYENLLVELNREDPPGYKNFLRVTPELFTEIVDRIGPHLQKKVIFWRKSMELGLRIAITLRYMATGDSYKSLQYGFRVAHNTISKIISETCDAIVLELSDEVMHCPNSPEEWKEVADKFSKRWNFHNTIGANDGKHVALRCPPSAGSLYYNYKGFHSVILLALVDAAYKFLFTDVGANGNCSDSTIFKECHLFDALQTGNLKLP